VALLKRHLHDSFTSWTSFNKCTIAAGLCLQFCTSNTDYPYQLYLYNVCGLQSHYDAKCTILAVLDHFTSRVRYLSLLNTNIQRARLLMTPFGLLHFFIYDSTNRHYNLCLQCVMTLWRCVSEQSWFLFGSAAWSSLICVFDPSSVSLRCLPSIYFCLSFLCVCRPSNRVFVPGIEDTFPHDCISRCSGFPTIWLLRNS
jgi:hypothetical protein